MTSRITIITLFLVFAVGCSEDLTPTSVARRAIKGGEVETGLTSVVGIVINTGNGTAICSGTLIAPNLVLTAQHCVARLSSQYVVCGQSPFGDQYGATQLFVTTRTTLSNNQNDYRAVAEIQVPPGTSDTCGFDLALLRLAEPIAEAEATPVVPRIDIAPQLGETYTAVGYGHIGDGTGSGTRRSLGNRNVECTGDDCPGQTTVQGTEWLGNDGTCQGDSGGAAIDAQGRVMGALSRGPENCVASLYSGVWGWSDWIRQVAQSAASSGGYQAAAWVSTGVSEAPVNDEDADGVENLQDNCPNVVNPDQRDGDQDGMGDLCDDDVDGDGILDTSDNCPATFNQIQSDLDFDGAGDVCDLDDDNDGVADRVDNCRTTPNPRQVDLDADGVGDDCADLVSPCDFNLAAGAPGSCVDTPTGQPSPIVQSFGGQNIRAQGYVGCASVDTNPSGLFWLFAASLLLIGRRRRR